MSRFCAVTLATLLVTSLAAAGDIIYESTDDSGTVILKDTPSPASTQGSQKKYNHVTLLPGQSSRQPSAGAKKGVAKVAQPVRKKEPFTGKVEVYYASWCGVSMKALKYLEEKGIPHVAYDVEKDGAAKERFKQLGGGGYPLMVMGPHKMNGFSEDWITTYMTDINDRTEWNWIRNK